jgi:hypothetical protein
MTIANIRNMQDLYDNLDGLGYSPSVVNQIRPRIRECAKIYNRPLCQIDADYDAFVERWGTGHVAALASGFKCRDHFVARARRALPYSCETGKGRADPGRMASGPCFRRSA